MLDFKINSNILHIDDMMFEIVDNEAVLFDENFELVPVEQEGVGLVYEFCGRWYISHEEKDIDVQELKMIGKCSDKLKTRSFLGIHSGSEILNAVGSHKDWINKAKFLGVENLALTETNSLSGTLDFQLSCINNSIKPIAGITSDVISENGNKYQVKAYAKNFQGWQNLLYFNNCINLDELEGIPQSEVFSRAEDSFIIVDPKSAKFEDVKDVAEYYQLDTIIFEDEDRDIFFINNLQKFIESDLKPVLIGDAYYLEQEEYEIRERLWVIGKQSSYKSKNQFFKSNQQIALELKTMFDNDSWKSLFKDAVKNLSHIVAHCTFLYDTTSRHLPRYVMSEEEREQYGDNYSMFIGLLKKGFVERLGEVDNKKEYLDRMKKEVAILKSGDVIDYFLDTRRIVNFAEENDIVTGVARGSAGGSLVSYLLRITNIDPVSYGLIFERFLNSGRMGEWKSCQAFEIETDDGETITLNEKSLVKVVRDSKEINIFVESLQSGDEIIKY